MIHDTEYQARIEKENALMKAALELIGSRSVSGENAWKLANNVYNKVSKSTDSNTNG